MNRRGRNMAALILMLVVCCMALIPAVFAQPLAVTPLDVGNNNDYGGDWGGGDNWGGDWNTGGDWGTGGDAHYSGSSSGGSLSPVSVVVIIVVIVIVASRGVVVRKRRGAPPVNRYPQRRPSAPAQEPPLPRNHEERILPAITEVDPNFSKETFLAWSREVFITLQQAWTARDWSKIRPFEKEELFRQHELQLQNYIDTGRINVIDRINIRQAYLHRYQRDAQYEYITVYMETRMADYIIDEKTRHVVKGDPNRDYYLNYLLTFMRKTGVQTDPARSNHSTVSCPNCGAPVSVTSAGRCEYCDFIITTGEHDWVLSSLDAVKPGTYVDNSGVIINDAQNKSSQP